jgi:hypothetical protein
VNTAIPGDKAVLVDEVILAVAAILAAVGTPVAAAIREARGMPAGEPIPAAAATRADRHIRVAAVTLVGKRIPVDVRTLADGPIPVAAATPVSELTPVDEAITAGTTVTATVGAVASASGSIALLMHIAPGIITSRTIAIPTVITINGGIGVPQPLAVTPIRTGINLT